MPLVDYGSSGESSDEETECAVPVSQNKDAQMADAINQKNIFSSLPKPREHKTLDGRDQFKNLFLKDIKIEGGTKKGPAKITVPSVNDFNDNGNDNNDDDDNDDDDDGSKPKRKKIEASPNNVGLFAVLPPPKNASVKEANRALIPHVMKNQLTKPKMKVSDVTSNAEKGENSNVTYFNSNASDSADFEDDKTASSSYFGEGVPNSSQNILNDHDNTFYAPTCVESYAPLRHLPDREGTVNLPESYDKSLLNNGREYNNPQPINKTLELDDKALQILCGGKRKRNQMSMNIIDLSGEEIMPDSKQWLLKQLSEETNKKSSQKKSNGPSVQSRRKHQITYLAYQARAQALELQKQWSNNRMSRRQTQSRYGF